jgi:arginase family enzyme
MTRTAFDQPPIEKMLFRPVPSLLGARAGDLPDIGPGSIALAGVFCDHFGGGAPGGRFSTRQVRYAQWPAFGGTSNSSQVSVDVGDLNVYPLDARKTAESLLSQARSIRDTGAKCLFVSGDYSNTPPLFSGFMSAIPQGRRGFIRISRSAGMCAPVSSALLQPRYCSTQAIVGDLPALNPWLLLLTSISQPKQDMHALRGCMDHVIDLTETGGESGSRFQAAVDSMAEKCDAVFLSVDVDALSSGCVGSSRPRCYEGIELDALSRIISRIAALPLIAGDLTGFVPALGATERQGSAVVSSLLEAMVQAMQRDSK